MSFFFLLLILFCVIYPLLFLVSIVSRAKRRVREAFTAANAQQRGSEKRGGWSGEPNPTKAKKIGRDVGEYVSFEEIETTVTEKETSFDNTATGNITVEQQIVDAEWEEIK